MDGEEYSPVVFPATFTKSTLPLHLQDGGVVSTIGVGAGASGNLCHCLPSPLLPWSWFQELTMGH